MLYVRESIFERFYPRKKYIKNESGEDIIGLNYKPG